VNKLTTMRLLIDKKTKHKSRVLTEGKLDDIEARLEHTPRKSLKCLAQGTGVSKCRARTATQLLKLIVKFVVWCAVSDFKETTNCKKYIRVETTAFSTPPVVCEL
jgi:hypothetical protein